jgi:hypothetical protein
MKITKQRLAEIIKEEYTAAITEGNLQSDGLRELISDFVAQEVSGWQTVAKASLHKEVAENGFDISDIVMNNLGGGVQEGAESQYPERGSQDEAQYEVMVQMGKFLARLLNEGHNELADEFSQILDQADSAGMRGRKGW